MADQQVAAAAPRLASTSSSAVCGPDLLGLEYEVLEGEVLLWKAVLEEAPPADDTQLLGAFEALRAFGELPTRVLAGTKIGQVVGSIAAKAKNQDVRTRAKELVETWRAQHRKRKESLNSERMGAEPTVVARSSSSGGLHRPAGLREEDEAELSNHASQVDGASSKRPRTGTVSLTLGEGSWASARDVAVREAARLRVQEVLVEALRKAVETQINVGDQGLAHTADLTGLAQRIEGALYHQLRKNGRDADYKSQARSILFNLRDPTNVVFGHRVLTGSLGAQELPTLSAEEMASNVMRSAGRSARSARGRGN